MSQFLNYYLFYTRLVALSHTFESYSTTRSVSSIALALWEKLRNSDAAGSIKRDVKERNMH